MPTDERVLVIPTERFRAAGYFHGFKAADAGYRTAILDPSAFQFRPRSEVETDAGFKQLIPYVVLKCGVGLHGRSPSKPCHGGRTPAVGRNGTVCAVVRSGAKASAMPRHGVGRPRRRLADNFKGIGSVAAAMTRGGAYGLRQNDRPRPCNCVSGTDSDGPRCHPFSSTHWTALRASSAPSPRPSFSRNSPCGMGA